LLHEASSKKLNKTIAVNEEIFVIVLMVLLLTLIGFLFSYFLKTNYSAVVGSIIVETLLTEFAGKPPCLACSRTISSFGAL